MRFIGLVLLVTAVAVSAARPPLLRTRHNLLDYDLTPLFSKKLTGSKNDEQVTITLFQDGITDCGTEDGVNSTSICYVKNGIKRHLAWEEIDNRIYWINRPDGLTFTYASHRRKVDLEFECDEYLLPSEARLLSFDMNVHRGRGKFHAVLKIATGAVCIAAPNPICQQQRTGFAHIEAPSGRSYLRADLPPIALGNFDNHAVCMRVRFHDISGSGQRLFRTKHCALTVEGGRLTYTCDMPGLTQTVSSVIPETALDSWESLCVTRNVAGAMSINFATLNISADVVISPDNATYPNVLRDEDTEFFVGEYLVNADIDEFRVFFRVLTENEQNAIRGNSFQEYPALFSDNCLTSYYPFSSWDLRDVSTPSNAMTVVVEGGDVIKGQADLDCSPDTCTYDKNKDAVMDPPRLLLEQDGDEYTDFDGSTFYVRAKVHRRYIPKIPFANWKGSFFDSTDSYCGNWQLIKKLGKCHVEVEFKADKYAELTGKCNFQTTASGPLPKAYGGADETAVYGQARLELNEPFPLACQSSNMIVGQLPECQEDQTMRRTLWRLPFITYFKTRKSTGGYSIKIYHQATAVSVVVDQTVTQGTLDLSAECPIYTNLQMTGVVRTFVNWPYRLVIAADADVHGRPASRGIDAGEIKFELKSETTCTAAEPAGGVGTCVQEWAVSIKPHAKYLTAENCGVLDNLDTIITANLTVTAMNAVLQNNYMLPMMNFSFVSGSLRPVTTEHVDATAEMVVCKSPFEVQGEGANMVLKCKPSNQEEKQTEFVRSPRLSNPSTDRVQTAYINVVPKPTNSRIAVDWCQLLEVRAYSPSDPRLGFRIFWRKENGHAYGLVVDPFNSTQTTGSAQWAVPMVGTHIDYPNKTGCFFSFPVLSNYFCCGEPRAATTWSIEASVFIKFSGVAVIPQTAGVVRTVLAGHVRNGKLHVQAADTSAAMGGLGKQVQVVNLAISPSAADAALDVEPNPNPDPNRDTNSNPNPDPNLNPNPQPQPTAASSSSSSTADVLPIAAGVGAGCLLLGAFVTFITLRSCGKQSKPGLASSRDLPDRVVQMEKHLGGPTSSGAEPQATTAL